MKFTSKPITIEAVQWTGDNAKEMAAWFKVHNKTAALKVWIRRQSATKAHWLYVSDNSDWGNDSTVTAALWVAANDSWLPIRNDEWIIVDEHGFYPCKDDVFQRKYGPEIEYINEDDVPADTDEAIPYFEEFVPELRTAFNRFVDRLIENARMETVDAVNKMEDGTAHEVTLTDEAGTTNHVHEDTDHDVTDLIRDAMDEARDEVKDSPIIQQAKGKK